MLSSHLYLGLPCDLLVRGFQLNISLTVLVSGILCTWPRISKQYCSETSYISQPFFFFHWRYDPLWVLAFSVIFFHCALSLHCFLHLLTPIICKSSSLSAIHLFRGLPPVLVPIGFHCNILLGVLLSSIRITWPSQAILLLFIILLDIYCNIITVHAPMNVKFLLACHVTCSRLQL